MPFSRSGQGDQRRRRVLIEENLAEAALTNDIATPWQAIGVRGAGSPGVSTYSLAAKVERQPPITVLIPRRPWGLVVMGLLGLVLIAGLQASYGQLSLWPRELWPCACRSLDLEARGGLATWFASLLLVATALQSILIYRLRRHRADDYRGRYRVWIWLPLVWGGMATCIATHVGEDVVALLRNLIGGETIVNQPHAEALACCGLGLVVAIRIALEVRRSRSTLLFLTVAIGCYFAAFLVRSGLIAPASDVLRVMAQSTVALLGHLSLWLTVGTYSRFVFLQAQGLLTARSRESTAKKSKRDKEMRKPEAPAPTAPTAPPAEAEDEERKEMVIRLDESRRMPPEPAKATPAADKNRVGPVRPAVPTRTGLSQQADEDDADEEAADGGAGSSLSRAERRRLRKLERRERHRRAA
jgi:hypothetical protein